MRRDVQNPASVSSKPRPFGAVVRELLIEQGMVTAIGNPNWMELAQGLEGVSYESLRKAVTGEEAAWAEDHRICCVSSWR